LSTRLGRNVSAYFSGQLARTQQTTINTTMLVALLAGAEFRWDEGRSHFFPLIEYRNEHMEANPAFNVAPLKYEQVIAIEWDFTQDLPRRLSLESQGLVWIRAKPALMSDGTLDPNSWVEGNVYVALRWASKIVGSVGYEWTTLFSEQQNTHHFPNFAILWNITPATSLGLFAGGNRQGLKCISGVCRNFPAFQGVRLELVVRL
jgi:hypothetical protein